MIPRRTYVLMHESPKILTAASPSEGASFARTDTISPSHYSGFCPRKVTVIILPSLGMPLRAIFGVKPDFPGIFPGRIACQTVPLDRRFLDRTCSAVVRCSDSSKYLRRIAFIFGTSPFERFIRYVAGTIHYDLFLKY